MTELDPIPDRLIVMTFDDSVKSQFTFAAPLLKQHGFGATFFITEGLNFFEDKERYLTWAEVRQLHQQGFEIGNHTEGHQSVNDLSDDELLAAIEHIDRRCEEHGIPRPVSFCYPGYKYGPDAVSVLRKRGFRFARRGENPEFPHDEEGGRGPAYDPTHHDPLLVPTTGASGPKWGFDDFRWAVDQARDGKVAVLTFHGVPDLDHPWVHTEPELFERIVAYLARNDCHVVALRDLARYVLPATGQGSQPVS